MAPCGATGQTCSVRRRPGDADGRPHLQLLKDDALGVGGAPKGRRLPDGAEGARAVALVGPALEAAIGAQLARGVKTTGFALAYVDGGDAGRLSA